MHLNKKGLVGFRRCAAAFVVVVAVCAARTTAVAADWPGFRGPNALGKSAEQEVFPAAAPIGLEIAWKVPIGPGYSGVSVVGDQVVTAYSEGERTVLAAFDAATGKRRWAFDLEPTYKGHDGSHDGPIATPMIAGEQVFMLGAAGRLVAVSSKSGDLMWTTDLVEDHKAKAQFYGFGSSPLVVGDVVLLQVGAPDAMVMGFDANTGKKLWAAGKDDVSYQSCVLAEWDGRPTVLATGAKSVMALDPKDGKVHWSHETIAEDGGRGSGNVTPVPAGPSRIFLAAKHDSSMVIEQSKGDEGPTFKPLWEERSLRNSYNVPVYNDGHVYGYCVRFLTSVNAADGQTAWKSRLPGDGFLILVDGHLVVATKNGGLHVVRAAADEYRELASIAVFDDVVWSHPSFADGKIYARSQSELACVNVVRGSSDATNLVVREGHVPDSQFGKFLDSLNASTDKSAAIDRFLESQKSFPIIEEPGTVHFVYRGPGRDLGLGGDMFGARQDRPMIRVDDTDLFYFSMPVAPDARLNYAFMRDFETIVDPRNPRTIMTTLVNSEMEMNFSGAELQMSWFAMPKWRKPQYLERSGAVAEGRLESHELDSTALGKKHKIEVYLPAGYEASEQRYNAAYFFGGEDALKQGRLKETLDALCSEQVEPIIVVLVNESTFQQRDKLPGMFAEELIPFIDKTYRTKPDAASRAAMGCGFGAADAWFCALKNPGLVGRLGALSHFLFDAFSPDIKSLFKPAAEQPLTIYLDWAKYDFRNPHEAWDMGAVNREVFDLIKSKGYTPAGGEVSDGAGWPSWATRIDRMFTALFPKRAE